MWEGTKEILVHLLQFAISATSIGSVPILRLIETTQEKVLDLGISSRV
jgi:hypothetical protein